MCPEKMLKETGYADLINVFWKTKNLGHLPFSGGWAEQPMWVDRVMTICGNENIEREREEAEQRKNERR